MNTTLQFPGFRPSPFTSNKDVSYYVNCARYYAYISLNDVRRAAWLVMANQIEFFLRYQQWEHPEDAQVFLNDGRKTPRLKLTKNIIEQMAQQFRGNVARMNFDAKAEAYSQRAVIRQQMDLTELLASYDFLNQMPKEMQGQMAVGMGIPQEQEQGIKEFYENYQDALVQSINYLLESLEVENDINGTIKKLLGENLVIGGVSAAVINNFNLYGGKLEVSVIPYANVLFDHNAIYSDMRDAAFLGHVEYYTPQQIKSLYPKTAAHSLEAMQQAINNNALNSGASDSYFYNGGYNPVNAIKDKQERVPVVQMVWFDNDEEEFAWVEVNGEPQFVNLLAYAKANPELKEVKIVDAPEGAIADSGFAYPRTLRYTKFIPYELVGDPKLMVKVNPLVVPDIVLDYGEFPFVSKDAEGGYTMTNPYSISCWWWNQGSISVPLYDAVDINRLTNRALSVFENHLSTAGGSGLAYDKTALDGDKDEAEANIYEATKSGYPVGLNAKRHGIGNMMMPYNFGINEGTFNILRSAGELQALANNYVGINDPLMDMANGGAPMLGVIQLLVQKGTLIQEPYYEALRSCMLGVYKFLADIGKNMYSYYDKSLVIKVGDTGLRAIKISKDAMLDYFRINVVQDNVKEVRKQIVFQIINLLYEKGIIDKETFILNFQSDDLDALKRDMLRMLEAEKQAIMQSNAAQQQGMAQAQAKQDQMVGLALQEKERDRIEARVLQMQKDNAKIEGVNARAVNKAELDKLKAELDILVAERMAYLEAALEDNEGSTS